MAELPKLLAHVRSAPVQNGADHAAVLDPAVDRRERSVRLEKLDRLSGEPRILGECVFETHVQILVVDGAKSTRGAESYLLENGAPPASRSMARDARGGSVRPGRRPRGSSLVRPPRPRRRLPRARHLRWPHERRRLPRAGRIRRIVQRGARGEGARTRARSRAGDAERDAASGVLGAPRSAPGAPDASLGSPTWTGCRGVGPRGMARRRPPTALARRPRRPRAPRRRNPPLGEPRRRARVLGARAAGGVDGGQRVAVVWRPHRGACRIDRDLVPRELRLPRTARAQRFGLSPRGHAELR